MLEKHAPPKSPNPAAQKYALHRPTQVAPVQDRLYAQAGEASKRTSKDGSVYGENTHNASQTNMAPKSGKIVENSVFFHEVERFAIHCPLKCADF